MVVGTSEKNGPANLEHGSVGFMCICVIWLVAGPFFSLNRCFQGCTSLGEGTVADKLFTWVATSMTTLH